MRAPPKLRIAVDARSLLCAHPRGEGKSLLRLYAQVVQQRPDIEPVFFGDATADKYSGLIPDGILVRKTSFLGDRFNAWEDWAFPIYARLLGCRVMHCTSSGSPKKTLMPMVMTVHDIIPLVFDDGHSAQAKSLFSSRLQRGIRQAHRIIAVSEHTKDDLAKRFPACSAKVDVVHWGADKKASVRTPSPAPTLLAFGGEARRKNTDYTLDRFISAAKRAPNLRLTMVGINSATQRRALADRIAEAGVQDLVELSSFVSEADLDALLDTCSALLYLSLYEGFGVPVLEAIARGLPVVASDRTSIVEVLRGAPGCFSLDDPSGIENEIVKLATDAAHRSQTAAAQAAVLPNFKWSITAQATIEALESALHAPASARLS